MELLRVHIAWPIPTFALLILNLRLRTVEGLYGAQHNFEFFTATRGERTV
jgi:hypothetical protein